MKKNSIFVPAGIALLCLAVSLFWSGMGSLVGYALEGAGLLLLGVFFLMAGIILGTGNKRRDIRLIAGGVILGIFLLAAGGKNLVCAGMDMAQGAAETAVSGCSVSRSMSLRRIFQSYYLEGITDSGKQVKLRIDQQTYDRYMLNRDFSVRIVYWEHSGVIREFR